MESTTAKFASDVCRERTGHLLDIFGRRRTPGLMAWLRSATACPLRRCLIAVELPDHAQPDQPRPQASARSSAPRAKRKQNKGGDPTHELMQLLIYGHGRAAGATSWCRVWRRGRGLILGGPRCGQARGYTADP